MAGTLFGDEGFALTAIAAATMIPTTNAISVLGCRKYGDSNIR